MAPWLVVVVALWLSAGWLARRRMKVLGILGPSGSGKTMTLLCIAGLIQPDSGFIQLNDRVLFDSSKKLNLQPKDRNV